MVKISSDSTDTETHIARVCDYLEKNGSYISPDVTILNAKGQTSVLANPDLTSEYVFKIQHDHLIPFGNFDFDIEGQDIVIAHDDKNTNKQHLALLEAMLALYNVSGKFHRHLEEHPLLGYNEHPEIIKHLLNAREGQDINIIRNIINKPDFHDELALLTFFKSRLLNCRLNSEEADYTAVLMPAIEFMNHHVKGAGFNNFYSEQSSQLSIKAIMPVDGSRECFTSYGRFDSLDTYLHCGFIDENVKYVRSVPLKIDLGSIGIISIRGLNTSVSMKDIPEHLQDLAFYFPKMHFDHTHNIAELSHALIPQENARFSLRRILEYVTQTLAPDISDSECLTCIGIAENQILSANATHYDSADKITAETVKNSEASDHIQSLIETQRKKLKTYTDLVNS